MHRRRRQDEGVEDLPWTNSRSPLQPSYVEHQKMATLDENCASFHSPPISLLDTCRHHPARNRHVKVVSLPIVLYRVGMQIDFDLVDIALFLHIAETQSLTHGAELSYLSVPSASTRIKNVEERLHVKLLYRTSQGVTLTPAGKAFLAHGLEILHQIDKLYGNLQDFARGIKGNLRFFGSTTCVSIFLPPILRTYLAAHPDVAIDIQERLSQDVVRAVRDGTADIGIVSDTVSTVGLQVFPFHSHRYVLVTSNEHALANSETVTFEDTLGFDYVGPVVGSVMYQFLQQAAARSQLPIRARVQVNGFEALCRMVEGGIGIGIVPEPAALQYVETMKIRILQLNNEWAFRTLQICVKNREELSSFSEDLLQMLIADAVDRDKSRYRQA
jgi:DNA-binding transcriptional LysR family regulator